MKVFNKNLCGFKMKTHKVRLLKHRLLNSKLNQVEQVWFQTSYLIYSGTHSLTHTLQTFSPPAAELQFLDEISAVP